MKFILLSIAAMFIKLTVKHFLTLKPYCFWTFRSRDWIWPKQKGCQILCFFCFDLAGPSLEEKPRNKIYVPNLDRWTPLQNRHQPKVHILYLGHVYQLSYHRNGNPVNIISFWNPFFVELSNQGQILNLIQKTRNQILDTNVSPGPPLAPG